MEEKEGTNKIVIVIAIILLALIIGIVVKVAVLDSSKLDMKTSSELLVEQTEIKYKQKEQEKTKEQTTTNTEEMELGEAVPNDQRLEKLATIYNNSSFIKELNEKGTIAKANVVNDTLNIYINGKGIVLDVKLKLEGNVLSTEIEKHTPEEISNAKSLIAIRLIDSVGVDKGLEEGVLYKKLNSDLKNLGSYSLEKDGFEIKDIENGNGFILKIDLNNSFSYSR